MCHFTGIRGYYAWHVIGKKKEEAIQMGEIFMKMIRGEATDEEIDSLEEASALRDIAHMPGACKMCSPGLENIKRSAG